MRKTLLYLIAATAFSCSINTLPADDDLFSEITMESVFASSSQSDTRPTSTAKTNATLSEATRQKSGVIDRVTSVKTLLTIIQKTDVSAKQQSNAVRIDARKDGWRFPARIEIDLETDQLLFRLGLVTIPKTITTSSSVDKTLFQLLSAGDARANAFFSFDDSARQLVIRGTLSNRNVTADRISERLGELASMAAAQADRWSKLKPDNKVKPASVTTTSSKPASPAVEKSVFSLIGTWSATPVKGEAYAIAFTGGSAGGTFKLVHLKAGKSNSSVGDFKLDAQELVLTTSGMAPLTGKFRSIGSDQFNLQLGSAKIEFRRQK